MIVAVALAAYLIGSIPTADWMARLAGHDLRRSGTGNPGTANALGLAGPKVAMTILAIDAAKGALAVVLGRALLGTEGGLVAAAAVAAGQVLNPWFRFKGGKGLGVSFGAMLAAFPPAVALLVPVIGTAARLLRSAARGTLVALAAFLTAGLLWGWFEWDTWWGVDAGWGLASMVAGLVAFLTPKFVIDVRREGRSSDAAGAPAGRATDAA